MVQGWRIWGVAGYPNACPSHSPPRTNCLCASTLLASALATSKSCAWAQHTPKSPCCWSTHNTEQPPRRGVRKRGEAIGHGNQRIETSGDTLYDPKRVRALRDAHAPDRAASRIFSFSASRRPPCEPAQDALAYGGTLSFTCHHSLPPVPVDVGRLHDDPLQVMGTSSWDNH